MTARSCSRAERSTAPARRASAEDGGGRPVLDHLDGSAR